MLSLFIPLMNITYYEIPWKINGKLHVKSSLSHLLATWCGEYSPRNIDYKRKLLESAVKNFADVHTYEQLLQLSDFFRNCKILHVYIVFGGFLGRKSCAIFSFSIFPIFESLSGEMFARKRFSCFTWINSAFFLVHMTWDDMRTKTHAVNMKKLFSFLLFPKPASSELWIIQLENYLRLHIEASGKFVFNWKIYDISFSGISHHQHSIWLKNRQLNTCSIFQHTELFRGGCGC